MKPIWMMFTGGTDEGRVEAGKWYKIVRKEKEPPLFPGAPATYSYVFIDDHGNEDRAASKLFVRGKNNPYKKAA